MEIHLGVIRRLFLIRDLLWYLQIVFLNTLHFPMLQLEAFGPYLFCGWDITNRQSLIHDTSLGCVGF